MQAFLNSLSAVDMIIWAAGTAMMEASTGKGFPPVISTSQPHHKKTITTTSSFVSYFTAHLLSTIHLSNY